MPFLEDVSVLSVDDTEATRYARRRALEAAGFSVFEAVNGLDALAAARQRQPTVVVLDVNLPDIDGYEVCRRLKNSEETAGIAVLQISAMYHSDEARVTALEGGADAYLSEPVDPKVLQATVNALARVRKAEREQARLNEQLHEQAARLSAVLDNTSAVVYVTDADGRLQLANKQFRQLFGDIAAGTRLHDLFPPEVADAYLANNRKVLDSGESCEFEEPAIHDDGPRTYLSVKVPLYDGQGRPTAICGISTDITRRKQADEQLRQSERRFRRLVESNIVGVILADAERILDANDLFLNMVGYSRQELTAGQLSWRAMTVPESADATARAVEDLEARGTFGPYEKEYFRKDGSRVPILIGGAALSESGERMCFVLDLSELRKTEAALRDAQKMESLGFLAGGVAHNFNNLLVGIMGNVSLVLSDLPGHPEAQERLESALTACERAAQLASELLAYAGKGHYFPAPVNLSTMIERDLRGVLRGSIPARIDVRFELDPSVPELRLDANQMRQVITNLTQNAAEAIEGDSGQITIRTELREAAGSRSGREVVLSVADNGIGMDEATQAKVFDPFFSTKFTGRGLGLAAVAGIVRACGGRVRVRSAPGQGSAFEVFLPAAGAPAAQKRTVLVVDDEPLVQDTVRAALERAGFSVLVAAGGTRAVEIVADRSRTIDLVLLDLAMPEMGGEETLTRIRELRPDTPVVICSGYPEGQVAPQFSGKNVQGYLKKPFTAQRLVATASELTRREAYAPAP